MRCVSVSYHPQPHRNAGNPLPGITSQCGGQPFRSLLCAQEALKQLEGQQVAFSSYMQSRPLVTVPHMWCLRGKINAQALSVGPGMRPEGGDGEVQYGFRVTHSLKSE